MTELVREAEKVYTELFETLKVKNSDYGSAVDITYLLFGEVAQLVRLWDKLLRLTQLHISGMSNVKDESVTDTLADLANYTIIALSQRRLYDNAPNPELFGESMQKFVTSALFKRIKGEEVDTIGD